MKTWMVFLSAVLSFASHADLHPVENAVAPGGKIVYYILGDGIQEGGGDAGGALITSWNQSTGKKDVLLSAKPDPKPEKTLESFHNLKLSPDAKTLYFETAAWATSGAIHALDITSRKTKFVTDGSLICIVGSGQHQGGLIVQQHRYFVQGGSYNHLYLYDPNGKNIGLVAGDNVTKIEVLTMCQSLG